MDTLVGNNGLSVEHETVNGADAYSTGGITVTTGLGRVDEYSVSVDNQAYQAAVTGVNGSDLTVQLYEAEVDTTTSNATEPVSWVEVADAADITGDMFTYIASRQ